MGRGGEHRKANAAKPGVPAEAAKAFAEVELILAALSPADLAKISTDIPRAVAPRWASRGSLPSTGARSRCGMLTVVGAR